MAPIDPRVIVIVTFVGGPLHGLQQALDSPAEQFWRDLPNGSALLYGRRWMSADDGGDSPAHAVYSPVGMSEHAFRELLPTVELELRDQPVAAFSNEANKQSRGTS
ncbi:hypothetical protein [Noviluteimonas dokdonensis]|nr:hypothetical protein [Lysobacter dokdonensis]